jgi:hypothetical protein
MDKEITSQFAQVRRVIEENRDRTMIAGEIDKLELLVTAAAESAAMTDAHLEKELSGGEMGAHSELGVTSIDEDGNIIEAPLAEDETPNNETPVTEIKPKRRR